jgi:hypothetical protein
MRVIPQRHSGGCAGALPGRDGNSPATAPALASPVTCSGAVSGISTNGNLDVPAGVYCLLSRAGELSAQLSTNRWPGGLARAVAVAAQSAAGMGLHATSAGSASGLHTDVVACHQDQTHLAKGITDDDDRPRGLRQAHGSLQFP